MDFLATEILLFSGLMRVRRRTNHPEVFSTLSVPEQAVGGDQYSHPALQQLLWPPRYGPRNTAAAERVALPDVLGGFGFLGIKFVEYEHKWKGLLWGFITDAR